MYVTGKARAPALDVRQLAVHLLWLLWFGVLLALWPELSVPARAGLLALGLPLHFWSYAVLHDHAHLAVVRFAPVRAVVSRTLGLSCGFPFRAYQAHHVNHHRYNGGEGDWGALRPGEGALRYCLRWALLPWVFPFPMLARIWRQSRRQEKGALVLDVLFVDGVVVGLCLWRPSLGLAWLATLVAGQAVTHWLNLAAHAGSDASYRSRLAVTSLSRPYNALCFNAGYHQAHHLRPQEPWRALPLLHEALTAHGLVAADLVTRLAPVHPSWMGVTVRSYDPRRCEKPGESKVSWQNLPAVI
jgi:fatty acid desaturase